MCKFFGPPCMLAYSEIARLLTVFCVDSENFTLLHVRLYAIVLPVP